MENPVRRFSHNIWPIIFGVHLSLATFLLLKKRKTELLVNLCHFLQHQNKQN